MNIADQKFKDLLQDELNRRYLIAQGDLTLPATTEVSTSIHEIGVLRGYMKGMLEAYDLCTEIEKQLSEPEKKV